MLLLATLPLLLVLDLILIPFSSKLPCKKGKTEQAKYTVFRRKECKKNNFIQHLTEDYAVCFCN